MGNFRIAILLFGSGACALSYQTVWLRIFREIFGASTAASAAVLAIFMGGLGIGSWLLGPRADRAENPLRFYAILELIVAVVAGLSPFLLDGVRTVYLALGGVSELGGFLAIAVRLILSSLVLAAAVIPMGGTLPAAARAAIAPSDSERRAPAFVYGSNTLGSVVGAVVPTFLLFDVFGIRLTLWFMVLVNALIALAALSYSRQLAEQPMADSAESAAAVPPDLSGGQSRSQGLLLLAAAFTTGFVFFLIEIVWYRMAGPILGGSTYTFALILAFALLGIGSGGLTYAVFPIRNASSWHFGFTCAVEGVMLLLPFALGDRVALLALALRDGLGVLSFGGTVVGWSVVTAILVFPTAFVAGYQFPLLIALKGRGRRGLSSDIGRLYAANTLGAITGSLAGGFGFLPLFGAIDLWVGCGLLLGAMAILFSLPVQSARPVRWRWATFVPLVAVAALTFADGPSALWRHSPIGAGRMARSWKDANGFQMVRNLKNSTVIEEYDGTESAIAFTWPGLALMSGGKSDGSVLNDALTQTLLGALPAILHPDVRDALVIGLASGQTANALAVSPSEPRVLVAELEPAVLRFTELASATNDAVLDHPNVEVFLGDGRELAITSKRDFDVIVSEPSNPFRAGLASFYTVEFFQHARDKLKPGGYFIQWTQGYEITPQAFQIVLTTMRQVFPEVSVWGASGTDYILVATREPQVLDIDLVRSRLTSAPFRKLFGRICRIWDAESLLGFYLANPGFTKTLTSDPRALVNTDDRPVLEYEFANSLGRSNATVPPPKLRLLASELGLHRPRVVGEGGVDWTKVERRRSVLRRLSGGAAAQLASNDPLYAGWSAFLRGDIANARRALADTAPPDNPLDLGLWLFVRALGSGEESSPLPSAELDRLRQLGLGAQAKWLETHWALSNGHDDRASRLAAEALAMSRSDPWTWQPILTRAFDRILEKRDWSEPAVRRISQALLDGPLAGYAAEDRRRAALRRLTSRLESADLCKRAFLAAEPYPYWVATALQKRLDCYANAEHPLRAEAERDMLRYLANTSQSIRSLVAQQPSRADVTRTP